MNMFSKYDTNGDNALSKDEHEKMAMDMKMKMKENVQGRMDMNDGAMKRDS